MIVTVPPPAAFLGHPPARPCCRTAAARSRGCSARCRCRPSPLLPKPTPLSALRHRELAVHDLRLHRQQPALGPGFRPCLMAFSTRPCSIIGGKAAERRPSGTSISVVSGLPCAPWGSPGTGLDHRHLAAEIAHAVAAAVGLAQVGMLARSSGSGSSASPRRASGSVSMRWSIEASVLKKCGSHLRLHGRHARLHHLALELLGLGRLGGLRGLHLGLQPALCR